MIILVVIALWFLVPTLLLFLVEYIEDGRCPKRKEVLAFSFFGPVSAFFLFCCLFGVVWGRIGLSDWWDKRICGPQDV